MKVERCFIDRNGIKLVEGKRWAQVYQARFIIDTDGAIGPLRVQQDARNPAASPTPVPTKGSSYNYAGESDLSSFAQDFVWTRNDKKATQWFCEVTWRPLDPAEGGNPGGIQTQDPIARPVIAWWEFEETTEIVQTAKLITPSLAHVGFTIGSEGPIVNAAGKPFDSYPERPKSQAVLVFQRNFSSLTKVRQFHDTYVHRLNSDSYRGAVAKTLYVRRISCSQPQFEANKEFYTVQVSLAYDKNGWKFDLVNRGLCWRDPAAVDEKKRHRYYDLDGDKITEPVLLTATGGLLEANIKGNNIYYEYADTVSFALIEQEPA